jgi:heme-degrading monooxygenase HmoA
MYTRLFHGEIQPGKEEQAWQLLNEFAHRVKQQKGCVLNQVLRSGREIVGVTTWETQADLAAYADSELARPIRANYAAVHGDADGANIRGQAQSV